MADFEKLLMRLILSISDDLAYQTESEKKSYGGGGGVVHRGSSKNRGHQSEVDEKNQGNVHPNFL